MKYCKDCHHSVPSYNALLCTAENLPKPVQYMRAPQSSCGDEAVLYEDRSTPFAELEQ